MPAPLILDTSYDEYATPRQREYLEAIREHGSAGAAAKELGVHKSAISRSCAAVRKKAALHGYAPDRGMEQAAPEGTYRDRTSTLWKYDPETGLRTKALSWEINKPLLEDGRLEAITEFAESLTSRVPAALPVPEPVTRFPLQATVYPMGDPHIGMYSWAEETGDDFDIDIAGRELKGAMSTLVNGVPPTEQAVVVNLGDFYHGDNSQNRTTRSGNVLDVDTRWQRVFKLGAELMIDLVDMALQKHKRVLVRNAIGNHDDHSSVVLSLVMAAHYRNEPRVEIDCSPSMFWYWHFGEVLLGVTHGDKTKLSQLPLIMAADQSEAWGRTKFRHWFTGHVHNKRLEEHGGVLCESFRTLAARDAYAAGAGYRSGRDMQAVVFDGEYGEVGRNTVNIRLARRPA